MPAIVYICDQSIHLGGVRMVHAVLELILRVVAYANDVTIFVS